MQPLVRRNRGSNVEVHVQTLPQNPRWRVLALATIGLAVLAVTPQASAQTLETQKLSPTGGDANVRMGETVAISGSSDVPSFFLAGGRLAGGSFHAFLRDSGGTWAFSIRQTSTSTYIPVSAWGDVGLIGYELSGTPLLWQLLPFGEFIVNPLPNDASALDRNAERIVVGGKKHFGSTGRADVYRRAGRGSWEEEDTLFPEDFFVEFGTSVAISPNGLALAVGAPEAGDNGEVYIYLRIADAWTPTQTLLPPVEWQSQSDARFGEQVSLSATHLAVGAPEYDRPLLLGGVTVNAGAVVLFDNSGLGYTHAEQISGAGTGDRLGNAIDLSNTAAGERLLAIGVPGRDLDAADQGEVLIYQETDVWRRLTTLRASDGAMGDALGTSVSLFEDHVAAGAPGANLGPGPIQIADAGAVYIFEDVAPLFADGFETGNTSAWN